MAAVHLAMHCCQGQQQQQQQQEEEAVVAWQGWVCHQQQRCIGGASGSNNSNSSRVWEVQEVLLLNSSTRCSSRLAQQVEEEVLPHTSRGNSSRTSSRGVDTRAWRGLMVVLHQQW